MNSSDWIETVQMIIIIFAVVLIYNLLKRIIKNLFKRNRNK